jgi:hypothetical protein
VCKDALRVSRDNPDKHLRRIYEDTVAIAFMGTPHNSSVLAMKARIPAMTLGLIKQSNRDL